jgi:histone acetyltransferase
MDYRVESDYYKSINAFKADFARVVENCRSFNDPKSVYVKCANKLDSFFKGRLKAVEELPVMQQ